MKLENYETMVKYIDELETYAKLCEDELGEYWMNLVEMFDKNDHMSDEFEKAYQKEVIDILVHTKENTKIVEKTRTQEITYEVLEWWT